VFGSSRIQRGDPIYDQAKKLCYELARLGAISSPAAGQD